MWKKIKDTLLENRMLAISIVSALVLIILAALFLPKLMNQETISDNQQIEQQAEQQTDQQAEQQANQQEQEPEGPKTETDANESLLADAASTEKPDAQPKKGNGEKKESVIDKIVNIFTGNDGQEDAGSDETDGSDDTDGSGETNGSGGTDGGDGTGGSDDTDSGNYSVIFVTDGGSNLKQQTVTAGTKISSLPTPYKDDYIFLGWYYDAERTLPVASTDTIQKATTLYASYAQETPLEILDQVSFASAQNVGRDFSIKVVVADKAMDAATVMAGITAENLTDPKQKDIIQVTGGNGTFTISGKNPYEQGVNLEALDGFAEGSTFRVSLNDARLHFQGQPDSVREYNFTTDKEEVVNLSLKDSLKYISVQELSNITNNGENVAALSIALYQAEQDGKVGPTELTQGTFEYAGELSVGDAVAVYAGLRPDLRSMDTPKEQLGDVGYVEITGRDGNCYSYKNAAAEDVIFEPDMLPVSILADKDGDSGNHAITVDNLCFDYSADVYANIELDSQTTVDVGDFLMFYSGDFGTVSGSDAAQLLDLYGKITKVTFNDDGTTTVLYTDADWNEVQAAMDIYTSQRMTGAELIEGIDTEELEAQIEQQAIDSGFAEEAAQYLASLALATDNFTELSENVNLQDFKVTLEDGTPISPEQLQLMDNSIKVDFELEDDYPKASISIHPKHFDGVAGSDAAEQGLSISLEIKAKITIGKRGSDNQIVITVSGTFVEEVGVDMGLSSKAVWKVWGIFPYIAEYRVTANVDLLNYTGIEVNATMVTKTADDKEDDKDDEGEDITEMIKNLLESVEEEGEDEDSEETSNNLVKRYSEMLEAESDFIKIVDQNITEKEKQLPPPIPIIAVNFSLDFVVQLDACVSIGFDFEYMTGKRYTFAIDVFGKDVKCDTVVLIEEAYEFSFYSMGRLTVRAGLEMEFEVGLFSTKLDSVGVTAQTGAYTKLWGYFYYELKYTASKGRSQKYSGAMLIEVGVYLELGLKAQVLDGYFSKELNVLEKEWPLWSAGRADNILDFATEEEDMPDIKLKQYVQSTVIPDSVFSLDYLDLKDGKEKTAVYNDYFDESQKVSETNRRNFIITMTNSKFSYDPQTNTISVHPAEGDKKLEGEMIITWINYPLAFSSRPIQRTISLYWDNVRDGYVIVPYTNGGSYIPIMEAKYESRVTAPADPQRPGYSFEGWYSDEELTTPYVFPEKMPAQDANIYAKWSEREDTPYRVEHYQEQLLSGEYELAEAEDFTGTTNSYAAPEVKTYTGYKSPAKQEVKILPDGSAVLCYYYALQRHQVTFEPGEVGGEAITYDLKYGGKVIAPIMAADGYTFAGWDKEVSGTMGTEDVVYTAQWTKKTDVSYRVEYYVQQEDGRYALQHLIEDTGTVGEQLSAEELRSRLIADGLTADEKFSVENVVVFENMTVKGVSCETASIGADGKTIIKINYVRLNHIVTFDYGYDDKSLSAQVTYGGSFYVPIAVRTGYKFKGWSVNGTTVVTPSGIMGTTDLKYTALWTPVTYSVAFDKNNDAASGTMESMQFAYDTAQNLNANTFTANAYSFAGWSKQQDGGIDFADGANVNSLADTDGAAVTLYAVWKPTEYTITYNGCEEAENVNPAYYTAESAAITLSAPVRTGYTFGGWYENAELSGDAVTVIEKGSSGNRILYAKWTADADTAYRVEHYKEALDGSWALAETEYATGFASVPVTPAVKEYTGFSAPQTQTTAIAADGTTVVRYEYTRNEYTITLDAGEGTLPEGTDTHLTVKYGASFILPTPVRADYGFSGWYNGENKLTESVMPAENLALSAQWAAGQYTYAVNHYLQNVDGDGYTLVASMTDTAAIGAEVEAVINSYTGFTSPEETKKITIGTEAGANTADYYYTRKQYTLTWDLAGGSAEGYTEGSVYYGAPVIAPVPVKTGYSFSWDKAPVTEMPAEDIAYTASWTADTCKIMFCVNGGSVTAGSVQTREAAVGDAYGELATLEKAGYTFDGWFTAPEGGMQVTAETKVAQSADQAVYAHFTPISFNVTWHGVEGAAHTNPTIYNAETGAVTLSAAQKAGYTFEGWYESEDFSTAEVKTIPAGSTGDKNYYAKWKENSYKIYFHSNNGNDIVNMQSFTYTESKALEANGFTKAGLQFYGWASSYYAAAAKYTDMQTVSGLSAEAEGEVHLYAVWGPITYDIRYENLNGAENASDNPESFTELDNVIALHDPQGRTGYVFDGWYTDASFTNKVSGTITLNAFHTWTFYAKWTPNKYTITFDSCLGDTVPTETMLMTYDKAANLTLLSEITAFTKPGYTFMGWSTVKGGEAVYTDGQNIINLAAQGNVTLYAVWKLNVFTISYDVGTGTLSHKNPASYSIEDGDVTLSAPAAKDGYQFLGWYEGNTRVSRIVRGTQKDYNLTAKWAHGGIFTMKRGGVSYGSPQQYYQQYIVTRTLPEGTVATANPQYVYYRTVNGTAYGSTVGFSTGQDKYHFKHAGGEDVYLTFGENDFEKSFSVEEWWHTRVTEADAAASFAVSGTNRSYQTELYKIVDTVGTCQGKLGDAVSCTNNVATSYYITTSLYNWNSYLVNAGTVRVTDDGYTKNRRWTVRGTEYLNRSMSDALAMYRDKTATSLGFYIKYDIREVDEGYQYAQFNYGTSYDAGTWLAEYIFAVKHNKLGGDWGRKMTLPSNGAKQDADIIFDKGDCKVKNYWRWINDTTPYAVVDIDKPINFGFDAGGTGSDDWEYRNLYANFKVIDERAPQQVGLAPMAFGQYKAGDTISITVIYDEVIVTASGVNLNAIKGLPIANAAYVGGEGTNALNFTATLTEDFEVTPDFNNSIIALKPVTATVTDILGNR